MMCKSCGHSGNKENPLANQGDRIIPYCHDCLKKSSMAAGLAIASSDWFIEWNK